MRPAGDVDGEPLTPMGIADFLDRVARPAAMGLEQVVAHQADLTLTVGR
ncbi:MAG: hypothetical protein JNM97_23550 [Rhodoferax sp.]|nr:hypothetical protein [Rhodoferax sp.]